MNKISAIEFKPGKITKTKLVIDSLNLELPVTVISGKKEGKNVLITAGVHSCEYVGVATCLELVETYQPEEITGNLIVIPVVNRTGFEARIPTLVPEDGKNLNRMFPGDANGSFSQKLADFISKNIFPDIDFYIDLHSGEVYEDLMPYIYYVGNCDEKVSEVAKEAAKLAHVEFMVKSNATTGCYNYAGMMGIPSLLLERGAAGRWSRKEMKENLLDIQNILIHLGMLNEKIEYPDKEPFLLEHPLYQQVTTSGIWYTILKAGDHLHIGQEIGRISDYYGNILEYCYAEHEGTVLYITKTLWADKDTEVITYATLCDGEECNKEHHHHSHEHHHIHDIQNQDMESHFR